MSRKWIMYAPLIIAGLIAFTAFGGFIVQALWNWLLPPLFGFRTITFWQGLALLALCRILFGGIGMKGGGGGASPKFDGRRFKDRMTDRMMDRMSERYEGMTPEERERFRERVRERFGFGPAAGETKGE